MRYIISILEEKVLQMHFCNHYEKDLSLYSPFMKQVKCYTMSTNIPHLCHLYNVAYSNNALPISSCMPCGSWERTTSIMEQGMLCLRGNKSSLERLAKPAKGAKFGNISPQSTTRLLQLALAQKKMLQKVTRIKGFSC